MNMKLTSIAACVGLLFICTSTFRAAEPTGAKASSGWFQWRGPNRDGKSPDKGLLKIWPEGGPKLLWKVPLIGQGFSSVSFGGGLCYTTGRRQAGYPTTLPKAKNVYKRPGNRYYVTAIDMDGKVKWIRDVTKCYRGYYPGTRSTPTYNDEYIYLQTGAGVVVCCDAKTGKTKWLRDIHKEYNGIVPPGHTFGRSESVLIIGDLAVVTPGGEKVFMIAVNKLTGKTVWESGRFAAAEHCSPIHVVYKGMSLIFNGSRKGLVCLNAKTGKILWTRPFGLKTRGNCPTPAFSNGYLYWAVGYGEGGICFKISVSGGKVTARKVWRSKDMDCMSGGYVIHDGYIYGNHRGGYTCLELKTGKKMWEADDLGRGSLCWADGMLYLYGEKEGKANLATCSPKKIEIKGTVSVPGMDPSWAHPVVYGGRLYLRYEDNLFCFDVKRSSNQ